MPMLDTDQRKTASKSEQMIRFEFKHKRQGKFIAFQQKDPGNGSSGRQYWENNS
jgi:hypothetical protein